MADSSSYDSMPAPATESDAETVDKQSIQAAIAGFTDQQKKWAMEALVCPAAPQMGGKKKGRRATKKGGDMGAGILTAGTLLLLQAAAKSLLKKSNGKSGSSQRGGEVIQSVPAPFGGNNSLVQSTLAGGSMCGVGAQQGGKSKSKSKSQRKQKGGALDVSGDLSAIFSPMSGVAGTAMLQAETAATPSAPFVVTGGVSQDGGKKRKTQRKQKGGMASLEEAFANATMGGVPPTSPPTLTGGKRKTKSASNSKRR